MNDNITYLEWSEHEQRAVGQIASTHATRDDMFVRKLVNATVFRNRIYEHTSNECEEGTKHYIYVKPYSMADNGIYGQAIYDSVQECCTVSSYMEAEYLLWDGRRFQPHQLSKLVPAVPLEFVQLLLDHYIVTDGRAYETIYSAYDMDRNKIILMLKETKN